MSERLNEIRATAFLLPTVDSEVILELVTEIELLRKELHQRDKYIDEQKKRSGWFEMVNGRNQLMEIQDENRLIYKALRECNSNSVVDYEVPEFCTLYACVHQSEYENWTGNKHNCEGDESRRLRENSEGYWVCPSCNRSWGTKETNDE